MNEFEKRLGALRSKYKAEQRQITRDSIRTIGRLNTAIGQTRIPEARETLRARKQQEYENMRRSHQYCKKCYHQQLELISEEYALHNQTTPSNRQLRRIMKQLCAVAESRDQKTFTISFGDNRRGEITFS